MNERLRRVVARRVRRDERGVAVVVLAAMLMGALAMLALVIDWGNVTQERRQAQNAVDAAALAAANSIAQGNPSPTAVVATVKEYVARNLGDRNWSACTDAGALALKPDSGIANSCISWDANPPATTKVRVSLPRYEVQTFFGPAASSVDALSVDASATASITGGAAGSCALCALGPNTSNLQNGIVEVTGGEINVGTTLLCTGGSMSTSGTPQPDIEVKAGGSTSCTGATFSPAPNWNGPNVPDPLAYLPDRPDYSALFPKPDCNNGTANPGIYRNISNCTLTPGLFVVTGTLSGGTATSASGVTIFLTCGTAQSVRPCGSGGEAGGTVSISGNTALDLRSCTGGSCAGGTYPKMAIWYDRKNTATLKMNGSGTVTVLGTIYAVSASLDFKGTPTGASGVCASTSQALCSRVIVKNFSFSGQGRMQVKYVPELNVVARRSPQLLA